MLHYFPTIYPDELWYSVISRYHVHSGNASSIVTYEQLFTGYDKKSIGCLFPNNKIYLLSRNLPNDAFDINDIILNHTLFKYFCRMLTEEKKEAFLNEISHGRAENVDIRLKKSQRTPDNLKFCPLCKKEDIKEYGESYWHLSHQLPRTNICIKHKCRLIPVFFELSTQLLDQFMVPDNNLEYEVDYTISNEELIMAKTYDDYLHLPLLKGPTVGYNNLYQGLLNKGYGKGVSKDSRMLDLKKIYVDLLDLFGADIVLDIIGDRLSDMAMKRIKRWITQSPESYVLLCSLIKQKANITFSTRKLNDNLKKRFLALSKETQLMTKDYVANRLGISKKSMKNYALYYDIEPFWLLERQYPDRQCANIRVNLTEDEITIITDFYKANGYETRSQFFRDCVLREVDFTQDI